MADEDLIFRASLQDTASPGLEQLRQKAQQTGKTVGRSGASAAAGLDLLNRATGGALSAVNRFSNGSVSALGRFTSASRASAATTVASNTRIGGSFKGLFTSIVGGLGLVQVAMAGWRRLTGIEDARASLKGLGHDAAAVDRIMGSALAAVKGTAFSLDEAATTAAGAVAAGIQPGKELERTLRLVADAATIGRTSVADMGSVFNKVAASTKGLQGEVIQQLRDRGIPIVQMLAKSLNITTGEVEDLSRKGQISFAMFADAMEKGLGGAALASGETTTGVLRNTWAAISRFTARVLGYAQPVVKGVLGGAIDQIDSLGDAVGNLASGIATLGGPVVRFFTDLPGPVQATVLGLTALVLLHGPLLKLVTLFGTPIRGMASGLRGLTAGFTGAAAAAGSFGWQMQLLQAKQGIGMAPGASKLGSFFTVAGNKAKGFGKSLLGAVGGPAGLAITGAIAAVTFGLMKLGDAQDRARKRAQEHEAAVRALTDALLASGATGSEAVRTAANSNVTGGQFEGQDLNLTDIIAATGNRIKPRDLINMQLGNQEAQRRVIAAVASQRKSMLDAADAASGGSITQSYWAAANVNNSAAWKMLDKLEGRAKELFNIQVPALVGALNEHSGLKNLDKVFDVADLQKLVDSGAAKDLNDAFDQIAKSIGMSTEEIDGLAESGSKALSLLTRDTGNWRAASEAARKAMLDAMTSPPRNELRDMWASIADAAQDATEQAKTYQRLVDQMNGRPVALDDALQMFNDSNRALAEAVKAGTKGTKGNIESLIGKDGRINTRSEAGSKLRTDLRSWADQSATLVTAAYDDAINKGLGGEKAQQAAQKANEARLGAFRAAMAGQKVNKSAVEAMIKDLGLDQPVADIYGPAALASAQKALTDSMADAATRGQQAAERAGRTAQQAMDAGIQAGVSQAADWVQQNGWVNIPTDLDTDPAYAAYGGLKSMIERTIRARVEADIYMQTYRNAIDTLGTAANASVRVKFGDSHEAIGHVVQAAQGLVRQPMIARGGANILWAEPETDWEAYIPGARKNRARSEALMDVVARRFGGMYTSAAQIKPMAGGGISGPPATVGSGPGSITIGEVVVHAEGATDPEAVGAAVRRQLVEVLRDAQERSG